MDRQQAIGIAETYARHVKDVINPSDVMLYGSHAKDGAGTDSDIDIAVIVNNFTGDYWKTILWLHELTISVDTRIEPVLLDNNNDPSGFIKQIKRGGIII